MGGRSAKNESGEPAKAGLLTRLVSIIVVVAILLVVGSMFLYSKEAGRYPWQWQGSDWAAWVSFSKKVGKKVGQDVVQKTKEVGKAVAEKSKDFVEGLGEVDWGNLTDQAKDWFKSDGDKVTAQIATQREQMSEGEYAPQYKGEGGKEYDYGLQALEQGIKYWNVSLVQESAPSQAKKWFTQAVDHFNKAKDLTPDLPLLNSFVEQSTNYLKYATKRLEIIERLKGGVESTSNREG